MSENNVVKMYTRAFDEADTGTVLAWAVMDQPAFIPGMTRDNAQGAKPIVGDFLKAEKALQTQMAVVCRGAFGIVVTGPAAAINVHTGDVYIDPDMRDNRLFVNAVVRTASTYSKLTA